jgi:hypothetical protein
MDELSGVGFVSLAVHACISFVVPLHVVCVCYACPCVMHRFAEERRVCAHVTHDEPK